MTRLAQRFALGGLTAMAATLAACQPEMPSMTPAEAQQIQTLTARMTTRCVGRYLIDLPDKFVLNDQSITEIEGVTIAVEPSSRGQFDQRLEHRQQTLKAEKIFGEDTPSLMSIQALPAGGVGMVFDRSKDRSSPVMRTWELLAWSNGFTVSMTVESVNTNLSKYDYPRDARENNVQDQLARLLNVFSRLSGRRDDEIPSEQGVCFANGFLKGPPTDEEWIDMYHHWSEVEDVYFTYHYMSHIGPQSTTLPQRGPAIEAQLRQANGATLRKGARSDAGLAFDEWLVQRDWSPGVQGVDFTLEANSLEGNARKPLLVIDYDSGVRHPRPQPTLEEAAVLKPVSQASLGPAPSIALWDKVTRTLRPRPGAF